MGRFLNILSIILLCLLSFLAFSTYSQNQTPLIIVNKDSINYELSAEIKKTLDANLSDTAAIINKTLEVFTYKGYLKVKADSIAFKNDTIAIHVTPGNKFFYKIQNHNIPAGIFRNIKHEKLENNKTYPVSQINRIRESLIKYFENNGYPFAALKKKDVKIFSDTVSFKWELDKGQLTLIEKIDFSGNVNLYPSFIKGLGRIREGMPYSENKIKTTGKKISDLEYANLSGPVSVMFTPSGAKIDYPLEKLKANRFDGIAGLMSEQDPSSDNSLRVSGQMNLYLINSLGYGEMLDMKWRAPGNGSQYLQISSNIPYILGSPLGVGYELLMNKQDSTFLSVKQKPSLIFEVYKLFSFSTFAIIESNNVFLAVDYDNQQNTYLSDYKKTLYGLEIMLISGKVDHSFSEGWKIQTSIAAGTKNIKNENDNNILSGKTTQLTSDINLRLHEKIGRQSILSFSLLSNLQSGDKFLENELNRIGGFSTLKGFDEGSIKTSSYAILTAEYRLYTAAETYFSIISNAAWIEINSIEIYNKEFLLGLAAGLNFKTKPGIMSVYYGLGLNEKKFEFRNSKIHIGFISLF